MRLSLGLFVFFSAWLAVSGPCAAQTEPSPIPSAPVGAFAPADAPLATAATLGVPGGTPVKVSVDQQLTSSTEHAGEKFQFKANEDVIIERWVVVKKGAVGEGEVLTAERAGGNGHPGKMQLQFNWIYGADGFKIRLSDVATNQEGDEKKGGASTATIASYLILGPLGLFAHNFVRGNDVIVKPDQRIQIYTAQPIHVVPTSKVSASDGFAH